MEMDCNLKKMANFFKFLLMYLVEMAKNVLEFTLPWRNHFISFSFRCSKSKSRVRKEVLYQIL